MKKKIQKLGKIKAVILITIISIVIVIALDVLIAKILNHELNQSEHLIRAALISIIIAPFVSAYLIGLIFAINTLENNITTLATYDELTGLLNRRVFYKACEKSHNYSIRNKQDYCILSIDMDDFKKINEKYGLAGGDQVLSVFGQLSLNVVRDSDIVARLGGEEFAFFLPNTNIEQAQILAERFCDKIRKKAVILGTQYIKYTVSIGISINHHNKDIPLEEALKMADDALHLAIEKGGNQVEVFSSKHADS
ncbi:MAG: GGDEF domain-containing protein [Alcanivoracaceae bacterium]|nr:GGDEF domain-containing protein [Alcanivoracaceae bacterium]